MGGLQLQLGCRLTRPLCVYKKLGVLMLFTEEFISKIDEDPIHAILEACVITLGSLSDEYLSEEWYEEEWYEDELNNLMEGAGLIDAIVESNDFIPVAALPELEGSMRDVLS